MNALSVHYQITGTKQTEIVTDVQKLSSMILIKEVVFVQFYIHFYRMENAYLAHIQTTGIHSPILVLTVLTLILTTLNPKNADALHQLPTNTMENALPVIILITGMTLPECVSLVQKLISSM